MTRNYIVGIAFAFALLTVCSIAQAAIVSHSPTIVILDPAPADVTLGQLESDTHVAAFAERLGLTLPQPLAVDIINPGTSPQPPNVNLSLGSIPAGTQVNSYYLHFDPVTRARLTGSITFGEPILGLIVGVKEGQNVFEAGNSLDASNPLLGAPGTSYGFEPLDLFNFTDLLTLSSDRKTVTFDWDTQISADNMRIITAVPEPATWLLLAIAAATLAVCRTFQQRR